MVNFLIVIFEIMFMIFGGIALMVFVYCLFTNKVFKETYPKALECVVKWILSEFGNENGTCAICRMSKEYINPIIKVLGENGCKCVERNAVIFMNEQIAHYELQISDSVKSLDLGYLERLIQIVYYNEILPLYQNTGVRQEDIDVFVRQKDKLLFVYVGHCQKAYTTINSYRNEVRQREIEKFNKDCTEMIE